MEMLRSAFLPLPPEVETSANSRAQTRSAVAACGVQGRRRLDGCIAEHKRKQIFLTGLAPDDNSRQAAMPHHRDPVGAGKNLAQLVGDQDDA